MIGQTQDVGVNTVMARHDGMMTVLMPSCFNVMTRSVCEGVKFGIFSTGYFIPHITISILGSFMMRSCRFYDHVLSL